MMRAIASEHAFQLAVRVGCKRRSATIVPDEWPPRPGRSRPGPYRTRLTGRLTFHLSEAGPCAASGDAYKKEKQGFRLASKQTFFCFSLVFCEPSPGRGLDVSTSPDLDRALRLVLLEQSRRSGGEAYKSSNRRCHLPCRGVRDIFAYVRLCRWPQKRCGRPCVLSSVSVVCA